jgi:PRTRC genetic system protein E
MLSKLHEAMSDQMTLNLTIKKKGEEIIVMVVPKAEVNDSATDNIPPVVSSGNPAEVEEQLIAAIVSPLTAISKTVSGIKEFEDKQKKIDEENKIKKAEKDKAKKEKEKQKKEEAKMTDDEKAFSKLIVDANKAIEEKKDISAKSFKVKLDALTDIGPKFRKQLEDFNKKLEKLVEERSNPELF